MASVVALVTVRLRLSTNISRRVFGKKDSIFYGRKLQRKMGKYYVVVVRVSYEGKFINSRPCSECIKYMRKVGIGKVYYSTDDGDFNCEKVSQMEITHYSSGYKHMMKQKYSK
jgi:deoxycytidylate deaminase